MEAVQKASSIDYQQIAIDKQPMMIGRLGLAATGSHPVDAVSGVLPIAGVAAIVFLVAVIVVAFVQVLRDAKLDSLSQAAWLLFIAFIPIAGAVAWFVIREHNISSIVNHVR